MRGRETSDRLGPAGLAELEEFPAIRGRETFSHWATSSHPRETPPGTSIRCWLHTGVIPAPSLSSFTGGREGASPSVAPRFTTGSQVFHRLNALLSHPILKLAVDLQQPLLITRRHGLPSGLIRIRPQKLIRLLPSRIPLRLCVTAG